MLNPLQEKQTLIAANAAMQAWKRVVFKEVGHSNTEGMTIFFIEHIPSPAQ
jgi:hypothetical protein